MGRVQKPAVRYKKVAEVPNLSLRRDLYLQWARYYEARSGMWFKVMIVAFGVSFALQIAALILKGMGL